MSAPGNVSRLGRLFGFDTTPTRAGIADMLLTLAIVVPLLFVPAIDTYRRADTVAPDVGVYVFTFATLAITCAAVPFTVAYISVWGYRQHHLAGEVSRWRLALLPAMVGELVGMVFFVAIPGVSYPSAFQVSLVIAGIPAGISGSRLRALMRLRLSTAH